MSYHYSCFITMITIIIIIIRGLGANCPPSRLPEIRVLYQAELYS